MAGVGGRAVADGIGRVGAWSFTLQRYGSAESRRFVGAIEGLGYGALWFPESVGSQDVFAHAGILLPGGSRIPLCSGIANIWARDPVAMANGTKALAEAYPGRFVLGMGVSHAPSVEARGGTYERPLARMRAYLDAMDAARYDGPEPAHPAPRLLAALGPGMLELAAERADGAHTYFVPVEHTDAARRRLGADPVLAVEMTTVLETNPATARSVARGFAARYLELPNYADNLRRLGWAEAEVAPPGGDALIDAVVPWGDVGSVSARVREHLDAGADHVALQILSADPSDLCLSQFRELAPALLQA